nr:immunoglobulin heavy chain junction region [Mus musculus]MBK4186590.1 immunoglobulin heavy chain junction region [Mus musculus]
CARSPFFSNYAMDYW